MTPEDLAAMREMMQDLNQMLREQAEGERARLRGVHGTSGASTSPAWRAWTSCIEQMGRQMAAMQSLMQSLSPEQRQQLDDMMRIRSCCRTSAWRRSCASSP